jgi:hypothetical protein
MFVGGMTVLWEENAMGKGTLRFTAKIQGKEAGVVAAITPPVDVLEMFGTRGRVPVRGTINGFPYRSSLMPCGGPHMMPVNKALCRGAGARPGDVVEVVMERDEEERTVEAPAELKKELAKSKAAQGSWEKMSFTNKKEIANLIRGAKREETRARRLAKVMLILKAGAKWTG